MVYTSGSVFTIGYPENEKDAQNDKRSLRQVT